MAGNAALGLEILAFLARQSKPTGVKQVAEDLGIARATAYRVIQELSNAGWLVASGSPRRYAPSLKIVEIGLTRLHQLQTRDRILPTVIDLARETARPCNIAFYEDGESLFTDYITVIGGRVTCVARGMRVPAVATASGKILLAYQEPEEIARVIERGLPKFTAHTKSDPEEIADEIRLSRARAYALADREYTELTRGLAVPVFGPSGEIATAIGVTATGEVDVNFISEVLRLATIFSTKMSEELGYRPSAMRSPVAV